MEQVNTDKIMRLDDDGKWQRVEKMGRGGEQDY